MLSNATGTPFSSRVLVTGGAGFLGSHICDRLIEDGASVVCLDNLVTGARSNIEHLLSNSLFKFVHNDVTIPLHIEVDQIFNLACPASPSHYQLDPVKTTKTSVVGAINMLDLAKRSEHTNLAGIHIRSLWRPVGSSAAGGLQREMSIRLARALAMTKENVAPRLYSSTIAASMDCR